MIKLNQELIKHTNLMSGKLLGFGIDDNELIKSIEKNININECNLLDLKNLNNKHGKSNEKTININIRNIRKKFKYKKNNYIICNSNTVDKYLKTFVRDSIYINNKEIYYYMDNEYDIDKIISKYKRYKTKIDVIKCLDGTILKIDTSESKTNIIKDKFYYLVDSLINLGELIGDVLIS